MCLHLSSFFLPHDMFMLSQRIDVLSGCYTFILLSVYNICPLYFLYSSFQACTYLWMHFKSLLNTVLDQPHLLCPFIAYGVTTQCYFVICSFFFNVMYISLSVCQNFWKLYSSLYNLQLRNYSKCLFLVVQNILTLLDYSVVYHSKKTRSVFLDSESKFVIVHYFSFLRNFDIF